MLFRPFQLAALFGAILVSSSPVAEKETSVEGRCIRATAKNLAEERGVLLSAGSPGLIPTIYDDFKPKTTVAVYYNDQFAPSGKRLNALTDTTFAPKVYFPKPGDDEDDSYTLIMNDPDAPAPLGAPTFLHWIRRGLKPSCETPSTDGGSDVRFYVLPTPPPLPPLEHRYALTILREPKTGYDPSFLENLLKLTFFDIRTFEQETGAKVIGSTYFNGSLV